MAKPKQRHQVATPVNKNITPSGHELGTDGEYGWVIVRRQKVTILIPPLPVPKESAMPNIGKNQPQTKPRKATNAQAWKHLVSDGEKSGSSTPEKAIPDAKKCFSARPISTIPYLSSPDGPHYMMRPGNPVFDTTRCHRTLGVCSASKLSKKSRRFIPGNVLFNQSLRASNLDRKLQRAGGLSRWLASLGLDQFINYFKGECVNKFQLVNLTMKKLKDMGANAVGPRRKLIHAIDCLCQPYCFETL